MNNFDRFQSMDIVRKSNILSETIHKENRALLYSDAFVKPPKYFVNPFNKNSHQFVANKVSQLDESSDKSKEYLESIQKITEPPPSKSEVPLTSNQEIGFWVNHQLAKPLIKKAFDSFSLL
ncbi:unnamed protein product [Lepeophtheirus salmonis]|uniref:(salmon louse) hypothetical protein n=1 Tax=Lepeophtheirus salmonis TaxID=72036 RepID=A0A7R8HAM7_LEPSM|nr:unnamed protein product [Lepeophtheirus salmonis]CAF2973582.1 unnamed protein product [Lepeophtheirus salmonis]